MGMAIMAQIHCFACCEIASNTGLLVVACNLSLRLLLQHKICQTSQARTGPPEDQRWKNSIALSC
jgi:hypothetical protein